MKAFHLAIALACFVVLAAAHTASADGWSLGGLNPFASKAKSKPTNSKQPSTMQQISKGTKKVVSGTTDLVTLKWLAPKDEPQKSSQPRLYDRRSVKRTGAESSPGLFGSLFQTKEPEQPKTLGDWMAQKRPEP